jgi:hypothetical protein
MKPQAVVRNRRTCLPYSPEELACSNARLTGQQACIVENCQAPSIVAPSDDPGGDDSIVTDDDTDMTSEACEQDISLTFLGRAPVELEEATQALGELMSP